MKIWLLKIGLESGRDKMEAAGKHQIDDDVPIDEAAMLIRLEGCTGMADAT